jgi:hypothetical protein
MLLVVSIAAVMLLPLPENSYELAIIDKHHILANADSPRIVLAGGSNVAFGIDSAAIQNRFHVPVVNMGLHAGIGLGRILDDVSPFLHTGDMLLIIPEYAHFTGEWNGSREAYTLIFDMRQFRLLRSPYYDLPQRFFSYLSTHLEGIVARFIDSSLLMYSRDGFNTYGDYVKHLEKENRPFSPDDNQGLYNRSYLNHFFDMVDDFSNRGITVLLSYPSYEEQSFRNSAPLIQELDNVFRQKENLRVISRPEAFCFPRNLLYDTAYHLNAEGRTIRTEQLIQDLEKSGLFNGKP